MSAQTEVTTSTDQSYGPRARLLHGVPIREHRVDISGVSTSVLESGAGDAPPVILLHGPGEFAAKWLRIIPNLAQDHRVIAPDLPDHGASELTRGTLDANLVLTWLGDLIKHYCTVPPVLIGHLLGGAIASRYAAGHSQDLDQLVLIDTFGLRRLWPAPAFALALMRFIVRPTERSYEGMMRQCLADSNSVRQQMGRRWDILRAYALDRARSPRVRRAMRIMMRQLGVPALPPAVLRGITVPTTLIWGREDRAIRWKVGRAASVRYGWPLHVIEGAADDSPTEQPEALVRVLRLVLSNPQRDSSS